VADEIFADVVPAVTGGRAWVRMVVKEPRNPNNRGDPIALELLEEVRHQVSAERSTADAYYYAEPIKTTGTCLPCHGEPRGARDPFFPEYEKNGWKKGEVVGAVIARVAPAG
jgi:methyl-accepting chemotaxis protein